MSITNISPKQLHDAVQAGQAVELIDVRTPVEFHEIHASLARNVPLDQLNGTSIDVEKHKAGQTLYLICRSGSRAKQACEKLVSAGYSHVVNVEGGTQAWEQAGLPVVRGQKAISLERQVRIAAGLLVLIGALLGYFAHPYWIAMAAFIGAGLVFAGITDTCGMGLLLARMPWNRVPTVKKVADAASTVKPQSSCCG